MNKKLFSIMMFAFLFGGWGCTQGPDAKFTSQSNAAFAETIGQGEAQLVDVRTPGEFAAGHIPGAVNIDVKGADFDLKVSSLDKSRPVAVYCRSGSRSKSAAGRLSRLGFEVYELDRGIMNWNGGTVK